METKKALDDLNDAADLVAMVEELMRGQAINPAIAAGIKITLRTIRRTIVSSHDTLAGQIQELPRTAPETSKTRDENITSEAPSASNEGKLDLTDPDRQFVLKRKDLRASIERIVERP